MWAAKAVAFCVDFRIVLRLMCVLNSVSLLFNVVAIYFTFLVNNYTSKKIEYDKRGIQ